MQSIQARPLSLTCGLSMCMREVDLSVEAGGPLLEAASGFHHDEGPLIAEQKPLWECRRHTNNTSLELLNRPAQFQLASDFGLQVGLAFVVCSSEGGLMGVFPAVIVKGSSGKISSLTAQRNTRMDTQSKMHKCVCQARCTTGLAQ